MWVTTITKDTGDGRASDSLQQATPVGQLLYSVQTFPLTYQTPLVRISIKVTPKLRYNVGYQYYGYHEDFGLLSVNQSYRAHTGYTSLLWSFRTRFHWHILQPLLAALLPLLITLGIRFTTTLRRKSWSSL